MMKDKFYLIVAGSRGYNNYFQFHQVLDYVLSNQKQKRKIVIVSGGARGTDSLAELYAKERGYEFKVFPADWDTYGKTAGYIRNEKMHSYISGHTNRGCICFWDMESKGTKQNFGLSYSKNTRLIVFNYLGNTFLKKEEIQKHI